MRAVAALTVLLWSACAATGASAHASLAASEPRDGAVLTQAPKRVELHFNERVTAGAIHLIDATGRLRDGGAVDARAETIAITVPPDLPQGTSIVSYRVISADGHPVAGSVTFSVGVPSSAKTTESMNNWVNALILLARVGG